MSLPDPITVAIVGCGKQAEKHIAGYSAAENVNCVLVDADPCAATALSEANGWPIAETIESALSQGIDAIDICTSTPSHRPLIELAIEHGAHIFCEKPACESAEDCRHLADAASGAGLVAMIGFVYRFVPSLIDCHRLLRAGCIGEPIAATLRAGGRGSHRLWKHRAGTGGGAISEMMVHMIDLACWFFGAPASSELLASSLLRPERMIEGRLEQCDAEDWAMARLTTQGGAEVLVQADLVTPAFTQFVELQGTNGTLRGSIQSDQPCFAFCLEPHGDMPSGRTVLDSEPVNLYHAQMGHFIDHVRRGDLNVRASLADSVPVLDTMEQIASQAMAC